MYSCILEVSQCPSFISVHLSFNSNDNGTFTLCIADDHGVARRLWQLIDRVIQQIAVQEDDGSDPDVAPLDINVNYILDT